MAQARFKIAGEEKHPPTLEVFLEPLGDDMRVGVRDAAGREKIVARFSASSGRLILCEKAELIGLDCDERGRINIG